MYYEYMCLDINPPLRSEEATRSVATPVQTTLLSSPNLQLGKGWAFLYIGTKFWFHQLSVEGAPLIWWNFRFIFWISKVHHHLHGSPPNNSIFHGFARVLRAQTTREKFSKRWQLPLFSDPHFPPTSPTLFGQGSWHKMLGNLGFQGNSYRSYLLPNHMDSHLKKAPLFSFGWGEIFTMFVTSTLVRSKNEVRDINQKTQICCLWTEILLCLKTFQVFFIYPIPSTWTYKEPFKIKLKISQSQQNNTTKTCILPKFTPPLHPKKKHLQRITKIPTKNKHQNPSNPPRNIFWPSSWKNPMCCNSRLTGTAHGPEVEKFHPVSLPNPEGSLRTKKTRWVLGRTLQTLEIRSLLYVIVGVFVGGGE